jgi:hypothetical protein
LRHGGAHVPFGAIEVIGSARRLPDGRVMSPRVAQDRPASPVSSRSGVWSCRRATRGVAHEGLIGPDRIPPRRWPDPEYMVECGSVLSQMVRWGPWAPVSYRKRCVEAPQARFNHTGECDGSCALEETGRPRTARRVVRPSDPPLRQQGAGPLRRSSKRPTTAWRVTGPQVGRARSGPPRAAFTCLVSERRCCAVAGAGSPHRGIRPGIPPGAEYSPVRSGTDRCRAGRAAFQDVPTRATTTRIGASRSALRGARIIRAGLTSPPRSR